MDRCVFNVMSMDAECNDIARKTYYLKEEKRCGQRLYCRTSHSGSKHKHFSKRKSAVCTGQCSNDAQESAATQW